MKQSYKNIQNFIDDIHNELSIKETIKTMGFVIEDDFKGNFISCPFHEGDNTPSCQVTDNFWKCYACGAKGDLISFVEHWYRIDFFTSLKTIAKFFNISLETATYKYDSRADNLKKEWDSYVKEMSNAPDEIKNLQKDYFPQQIGYDKKINYIVLPFTSKIGAILGFTKRRIDDSRNSPKWIHSNMDDSLIKQCNNIFNLYKANREIKKNNEVVVTEGPKDVIAFQRISKLNTICVCGTDNINNAWELILPVKTITLAMDNDKAGIKATYNCVKELTKIHDIKNIFVVELPEGKDPYDISGKELENRYESKTFAIDYILKNIDDLTIINDIYKNTPDFNKIFIIKEICKVKSFSLTEAESWLNNQNDQNENNLSEKEFLLSIINCEDIDLAKYNKYISGKIPSVEKAKRILKLKYNMEID